MKHSEILKWRQDVYEATTGAYQQPAVSSHKANASWAISQAGNTYDQSMFRRLP